MFASSVAFAVLLFTGCLCDCLVVYFDLSLLGVCYCGYFNCCFVICFIVLCLFMCAGSNSICLRILLLDVYY